MASFYNQCGLHRHVSNATALVRSPHSAEPRDCSENDDRFDPGTQIAPTNTLRQTKANWNELFPPSRSFHRSSHLAPSRSKPNPANEHLAFPLIAVSTFMLSECRLWGARQTIPPAIPQTIQGNSRGKKSCEINKLCPVYAFSYILVISQRHGESSQIKLNNWMTRNFFHCVSVYHSSHRKLHNEDPTQATWNVLGNGVIRAKRDVYLCFSLFTYTVQTARTEERPTSRRLGVATRER